MGDSKKPFKFKGLKDAAAPPPPVRELSAVISLMIISTDKGLFLLYLQHLQVESNRNSFNSLSYIVVYFYFIISFWLSDYYK